MATETKTQKIPILMYHSIAEHASEKFRPFTLSPALFAEQIAYLRERGYTPITVSQCIAARQHNARSDLPERPVILTFDDGFADFFAEALPVLSQYHVPATLYVATAYVNGTSHWLKRSGESSRRMLTWEQVKDISTSGIDCGAHSHHHLQLDTLSSGGGTRRNYYLKTAFGGTSRETGREFRLSVWLSFHGGQTARASSGFTSACSVKYSMSSTDSDPFALPRLFVGADTSVEKLEALLAQPVPTPVAAIYSMPKPPSGVLYGAVPHLHRKCQNERFQDEEYSDNPIYAVVERKPRTFHQYRLAGDFDRPYFSCRLRLLVASSPLVSAGSSRPRFGHHFGHDVDSDYQRFRVTNDADRRIEAPSRERRAADQRVINVSLGRSADASASHSLSLPH